jgi:hypothetical protein
MIRARLIVFYLWLYFKEMHDVIFLHLVCQLVGHNTSEVNMNTYFMKSHKWSLYGSLMYWV